VPYCSGAAGLATLLFVAGCNSGVPAHETRKSTETRASLVLVEGLDEEGGTIGRGLLTDTRVVAFFRDDTVFADARLLTEYLSPESRVDVIASNLGLDGQDTGIPVDLRDSVPFVPLQPLANRFRAYAQIEEIPGRMVTLWRHAILCRYAQNADRRAEVFLAAAEQGLLRACKPPIDAEVRRWRSALPNERWSASVTLRHALDSVSASALLEQYGAAPYAAYGVAAGHHLIVRLPADSAALNVISLLRAAGIEALERALCGLPAAVARRGRGTIIRSRSSGTDPFHGERHMLASVLAARRELHRVRAGAPIVFGVDVIATATELRRLAADNRIQRFEPATKLDDTWVLPGAVLDAGVAIPTDIAGLDSAALFARLDTAASHVATECPSRQ
jgi:hypothetical protein